MKLYLDPAQSKEMPALIRSANKTRKRYPEGVVETVGSEDEARQRAEENLYPAIVIGPSRSSEGFRLYYLVRWLDQE
ncbi:MAG: hypothetical protein ACLPXB_03020 [Thiobacillaceae bacterium]